MLCLTLVPHSSLFSSQQLRINTLIFLHPLQDNLKDEEGGGGEWVFSKIKTISSSAAGE